MTKDNRFTWCRKNVFRSENDWESIQDKCCVTHAHTCKSIYAKYTVSILVLSTRVCILCLTEKKLKSKEKRGIDVSFSSLFKRTERQTEHLCCSGSGWWPTGTCVSLHRLETTTLVIILQRKSLNQAYGAIVKLIFIVQLIFSSTFPHLQGNVN